MPLPLTLSLFDFHSVLERTQEIFSERKPLSFVLGQ